MNNERKIDMVGEDLIKSINKLSSSPLFQSAQNLVSERSWAGLLSYNENHTSTILAWLLDPREGHGLGDFFLRKLSVEVMKTRVDTDSPWYNFQIDQRGFNNAIVTTEACISIPPSNTGRIDILIVDPLSQVSFVIERKDGAGITGHQLKNYHQWASVALGEELDHNVFYIVSGHASWLDESTFISDKWKYIDDNWVSEALDEVLKRNIAHQEVVPFLTQLRYRVFNDWNELESNFYTDYTSIMSKLTLEYRNEINNIKNALVTSSHNKTQQNILKLSSSKILTDYLPYAENKIYDSMHDILWFYARHKKLLTEISATATMSAIEVEIEKKYKGDFDFCYVTRNKKPTIQFSIGHKYIQLSNEYWPLYISISMPDKDDDKVSPILHIYKCDGGDEAYNIMSEAIFKNVNNTDFSSSSSKHKTIQLSDFKGTLSSNNLAWTLNVAKWLRNEWNKQVSG